MEMNIYAYKCKRCGHVQYPYRTLCRNCKENDHNEFDIVPLSKKGKLLTFTHLYTLPADYETVKLTLGIVELEDGNKITAQLNIKEPKIGMRVMGKVEVVRKELYDKRLGMVFVEAKDEAKAKVLVGRKE
jgi:uncharacterized OB-fold protein